MGHGMVIFLQAQLDATKKPFFKVAILALCWKTWTSWWLVHSWQEMTSPRQISQRLQCCSVCLKIPWCHRHAGTSTLGGKISMHDQRFKRRWFDPIGGGGNVQHVLPHPPRLKHGELGNSDIYIYIYVCALFPLNKTKRGLGPSQYDCCPNFHLYASIETRSSETCLLRKGASVASVMYPSLGIFFRDTLVASHMRHCHFFTKQVQTTGLLPSFDNIDPQSLYRMYRFVFFEFFMFMKD